MEGPYVGIDLGTTYSSVAIYHPDNGTEVLQIDAELSTPSCVFFGSSREYGKMAKKRLEIYPKSVAFDSKRMIGQKFNEISQQNFNWPFEIKDSGDNGIDIVLEYEGNKTVVKPLEVSAEILKHLRIKAQQKINKEIKGAVITVPETFTVQQKNSTKKAAELAGFDPYKIFLIAEPTAAAIRFAHTCNPDIPQSILIFDFGGGTFDITKAIVSKNEIIVLQTAGDAHLGGQDIDDAIVKYLAPIILQKCDIDVFAEGNEKHLNIVRHEVQNVKNNVQKNIVSVNFDFKIQENYFEHSIPRSTYDEIIEPLIDKAIDLTKTLYDPEKDKDMQIILVGGSSLIHLVREKIEDLGLKVIQNIPCLTAVAEGAAFYHYTRIQNPPSSYPDFDVVGGFSMYPEVNVPEIPVPPENPADDTIVLRNVLSGSLGFVVKNGEVPKLLKKNTPLPCRSEIKTYRNTGSRLVLEVYQGESLSWQHCKLVGKYPVKIPENSKPGSLKFQLYMSVNENMCLEVVYKRIDSESGDSQVFVGTNMNEESEETVRLIRQNMDERDRNEQSQKNFDDLCETVTNDLRKKKSSTKPGTPMYAKLKNIMDYINDAECNTMEEYRKCYNVLKQMYDQFCDEFYF